MGTNTQVAYNNRICDVMDMLVNNYKRSDILQSITEKYDIKEDQLDKDIKTAKERIAELTTPKEREDYINESLVIFKTIHERATEDKQHAVALNAIIKRNELKGIVTDQNVNHNFDNMTNDDIKRRKAEIAKRMGIVGSGGNEEECG